MSLMATMLFISEAIPLPTVPLLIIVGEVVLLKVDATKVAQSLMTDSVLFIMGSLMLAVAIVRQRLDKRIAWWIVRVTGTNVYWISFGITAVCGVIAAFIGEHTVAAMMLPVGVTLITLTSNDPRKVHNLAAVILFSISYGCSIAGVATPSGGARNAIIISYWKDFFYDPLDPATHRFLMDYVNWIIYAFPMFLLRLPIVAALLIFTFKPEVTDMSRAISRLRTQVSMQGPMRASDWLTILIFALTIAGWVTLSNSLGLGVIAIAGAAAFLIFGLVRWEDINSGVNWGVVLLYAAAISLGVEMKETGAAEWVAASVFERDGVDGRQRHAGLQHIHLASHHRGVEHHDRWCRRRRAGAHRAQDGRRRQPGPDQRGLHHRDLVRLRLPDARGTARLHHHLCVGFPQGLRLLQDRHPHDGALLRRADRHVSAVLAVSGALR